jgi:hypothetical protein
MWKDEIAAACKWIVTVQNDDGGWSPNWHEVCETSKSAKLTF